MDASVLPTLNAAPILARPGLRILVIDDDECVGAAIRSILGRHNGETLLVSRAYAGIKALESSGFDAVLVDLFMPGLNGLDAIAHIRRGSSIPIIAMSGFRLRNSSDSIDYLGMAMQRGASTFIRKPFAPSQLVEAIDRSINPTDCAKDSRQ
jgi:DNA-binding NtrC family response regulator